MATNGKAPDPPGFIDRVRDLIAKIFGSPGRAPQAAEHAAAGSVPGSVGAPIPTRPADRANRSTAAEAAVPRA